jgi:GNAT superfamily N-acetyltransferase
MDQGALLYVQPKLQWGLGYDAFLNEGAELICAQWDEVKLFPGVLSLHPWSGMYRRAEMGRCLHILTARDAGKLVGYLGIIISRHPMDETATCVWDAFIYASPAYRQHWLGIRLLKEGIVCARQLGASIVFFHERARHRGGGYLRRLGFEPHEITYSMVLK